MLTIVSVGFEPGPEVKVRPRPLLMGTGGKKKLDQTRLHCGVSCVLTTKHIQPTGNRYMFFFICMFGEDVGVRVCKHAKQNI